jgi:non-specific serine/threonine protein kinase
VWQRRHRDYFLALAEASRPGLIGAEQAVWLARLEREHDNIRAALEFCRNAPDGGEPGLRLTAALDLFWDQRGYFTEARGHYFTALAHPGAQARTHARAACLNGAGVHCENLSDYQTARALHEEALDIARELNDPRTIAFTLGNLGTVARSLGEDETARRLFEEVLAIHRERGTPGEVAGILTNLGILAARQGEDERALALFEEALARIRQLGNRQGIAASLIHLGHLRRRQGDRAGAHAMFTESLAIRREMENPWGIAASLTGLALSPATREGTRRRVRSLRKPRPYAAAWGTG